MTRYYVHNGESYDASYTTPEEARKAAIRALDGWRDDARANDGWADEAASVAWGEVREIATAIPHAGAAEEDGLDDRGVDYKLRAPDDDLTHAALSTPEGYVGAVSEAVAEELERVRADFAALHIKHEAVRKERDDDRDYIDDIAKRLDALWDLLCSNDSALPKDIMVEAEPGSHLIDEAARLLQMVARERDELRAALLNERGEGEPPSEGWARNDFDSRAVGIAWYRPSNADGSLPPAGAMDYTYALWVYREPTEPEWTWECEHADFSSRDIQGKAPTAREAMKAADAALAGSKS